MASGNDQTIHEIFADNDSENEDEFEGFDPEDISIDLRYTSVLPFSKS
jgi:hypothetical protein